MIEKSIEYLVHPTSETITKEGISELFSVFESDKASVALVKINDDSYHATINVACEKEKMGFVMKDVKKFDKAYNEETDSAITMKQLENSLLDDNNPKKKKNWAVPKGSFNEKSAYGIYKL